jgi:hypothetical protein
MTRASLQVPPIHTHARRAWPALTALVFCAAASTASPSAETDSSRAEIVVNGVQDIVVNGRARHCRRARGDPLNRVVARAGPEHRAVIPDGSGGYVAALNAEQLTGPDYWQRVGLGMAEYNFRAPSDDGPMCVGGRLAPSGFAGFRRIVDAAPYRGRRLRFTAWVATRSAHQVSFWLAVGTEWRAKPPPRSARRKKTPFNELLNGGNTNNVPFGGDHGWTPVLLETGPIPESAHHVSYGFNLIGRGDVWVYRPKLEIVDPADLSRTGDLIVIGRDHD